MANFTSNTYQLKREILNFTNKISRKLSKPNRKFFADISYGMLASGSCLLTDVVDQLHEDSKKIKSKDCLSNFFKKRQIGTLSNCLYFSVTVRRNSRKRTIKL